MTSRPGWTVLACFAAACGARTELPVGDGSGGATGDEAEIVPCIDGEIDLVRATPAVLFVIDRSMSMDEDIADGSQSKWSTLRDSLAATLPEVTSTMQVGGMLFPSGDRVGREPSCTVASTVQLAPALGRVDALLDLVAEASPDGATPTAEALGTSGDALLAQRAASTARAMVLATDGAPGCNLAIPADECECMRPGECRGGSSRMCLDDDRTLDVLETYRDRGVPTYVVGLIGDDRSFADVLDAMAVAGGRPRSADGERYYAATSAIELEDAFAAIRDQVGRCTFLTSSVPDEGGTIAVYVGGEEIPYDESGTGGWSWGDRANGEILLFGEACAAAEGVAVRADVACAASLQGDAGAGGRGGAGGASTGP